MTASEHLSLSLRHSSTAVGLWCKHEIPVRELIIVGELLRWDSATLSASKARTLSCLHSYFQDSPEMFDRVQVWALAGPLKEIQRLVPNPLLHCLCCVLREPSPQSEVLSALEQVFIKDLSVLCSVHLFLEPDQSPSS